MYKASVAHVFKYPTSITHISYDPFNNVYYFTQENKFAIYQQQGLDGTPLTLCGSPNSAGHVDGVFSWCRINFVLDIAIGNRCLFLLERNKHLYRIRKVDLDGERVSTVMDTRPVPINRIAVDSNTNELWVAKENSVCKLDNNSLITLSNSGGVAFFCFDHCSRNLIQITPYLDFIRRLHVDSAYQGLFDEFSSKQMKELRGSRVFDPIERKIYILEAPYITYFDLETNKLEKVPIQNPQLTHRTGVRLTTDLLGNIFYWGNWNVIQLSPLFLSWRFARILWIGKYKNEQEDCLIAKLPRDILREIIRNF